MRIAIHDPAGFSASSYYRAYQWLKMAKGIEITPLPSVNIPGEYLVIQDVLLVIRPNGHDTQTDLINNAKDMGILIWLDLDDNIWDIPPWNDAHSGYNLAQSNIERQLKLADIITVTTAPLQIKIMEKTGKMPRIVPNAIDPMSIQKPNALSNRIGYRGSNTHKGDVEIYKDKFKLWSKTKEIVFYGYVPGWSNMPFSHFGFVPFHKHLKRTIEYPCDVMVFPLIEDSFNKCKSNISLLEAVQSGSGYHTNVKFNHFHPEITNTIDFSQKYKEKQHAELVKIIEEQYNINDWFNYRMELLNLR